MNGSLETWSATAGTAFLLLVAAGMWVARRRPMTALWAYVLWRTRGARIREYHRRRYQRAKCHARPTLARRLRLFARHVRSIRLRATDTPDTGLATITRPDPTPFTARTA